jgi:hypothetical protein
MKWREGKERWPEAFDTQEKQIPRADAGAAMSGGDNQPVDFRPCFAFQKIDDAGVKPPDYSGLGILGDKNDVFWRQQQKAQAFFDLRAGGGIAQLAGQLRDRAGVAYSRAPDFDFRCYVFPGKGHISGQGSDR